MPKLLYVKYSRAGKILEGGAIVSQNNYNILSSLLGENSITTYYISNNNNKHTLHDYIIGFFYILKNCFWGLSPEKIKEIIDISSQYDYVFIDRSVYGIIAKKLVKSGYSGRIITFFHNVEKLYFKSKIKWWIPWRYLISKAADNNDRYSCKYSHKIIVLNQRDSLEIEKRYHRSADEIIPISLKDKLIQSYDNNGFTAHKPFCLFLGSYFIPNNEGILWFIKNVFYHVDIKMVIVGKGMSKLKEENYIPDEISVYSDVPDLVPFFTDADFMILPIFRGSGMKVKTCESLMYGKNIIATPEAFEGYELDYDKVGGLCNSAKELIDKINYFSENPIPRFNTYARQAFLDKYSESVATVSFRRVLDY